MKILQACPYCETPHPDPDGPEGTFFRCRRCDLIGRTRPREEMPRYYEERYFEEQAQDQLSGERNHLYEHILDRIEADLKSGRLLDVGCGCGFLMEAARKRGWQVVGIDPSEKSVQFARSLTGESACKTTLDDFETDGRFRVVTLVNVLDHSLHPWNDLRRVRQLMEPDGLVFIRVPNGRLHFLLLRWLQSIGAESSAHRFLVFHEFVMTPRFIRRLLSESGFKEIRIGNAAPTGTGFLKKIIRFMATLLAALSGNRILLAPSLEITARMEPA